MIKYYPENKLVIREKACLFKFFYFDEKLYFALYDYKSIFYSINTKEEVLKINQDYNPSLEFNDVSSLMSFLKENLIIKCKSVILRHREKVYEKKKIVVHEFNFFAKVDILSIKWGFKCQRMDLEDVEPLSQIVFIYPMHNLLLGIGSLINNEGDTLRINGRITYEDAKLMLKCNYLGKKCGFTQSIIKLLNLSSNVVNAGKYSSQINNIDDKNETKGRKSKFGGPGKKKKTEKVEFTEDLGDHTTQESEQNDIIFNAEKEKERKKKKKKNFL